MTDVRDVRCSRCGRSRDQESPIEALAWVVEQGPRGQVWLCPTCARTYVRAIEGKLPDEYW